MDAGFACKKPQLFKILNKPFAFFGITAKKLELWSFNGKERGGTELRRVEGNLGFCMRALTQQMKD